MAELQCVHQFQKCVVATSSLHCYTDVVWSIGYPTIRRKMPIVILLYVRYAEKCVALSVVTTTRSSRNGRRGVVSMDGGGRWVYIGASERYAICLLCYCLLSASSVHVENSIHPSLHGTGYSLLRTY